MATEKQINFLKSLAAERPNWQENWGFQDRWDMLSNYEASQLINEMLKVPAEHKSPVASDGIPLAEISKGSYWTFDGKVARVRESRISGRLYAEVLNAESEKFEYARGAIFKLKSRMTLDEAKAWGRSTVCVVSARSC